VQPEWILLELYLFRLEDFAEIQLNSKSNQFGYTIPEHRNQ
jgi:hypothetical protein